MLFKKKPVRYRILTELALRARVVIIVGTPYAAPNVNPYISKETTVETDTSQRRGRVRPDWQRS